MFNDEAYVADIQILNNSVLINEWRELQINKILENVL
jgi:hypothetical protein